MFLMCKAFLPPMIGPGAGDIINPASVSGERPRAEEREVGDAVVAMLPMTGLHCADIDLSAGLVAR